MLKIAVTGGIACGKSFLGSLMRESGVEVCDADELAHTLMSGEQEIRVKLVSEFGDGILDSEGSIDRGCVADIVFSSSSDMEKLSGIMHPAIRSEWEDWLRRMEVREHEVGEPRIACVMIPLLYEANMTDGWDAVICVSASEETCIKRLQARGDSHYCRRLELQMPVGSKADRADYVLYNEGTEASLRDQWKRICNSIMENKS